MNTLLKQYNDARIAYYAGNPIISDAAYDAIEKQLATTYPQILRRVGAAERGGKVDLPIKMGSLDQIHDQDSYLRWVAKYAAGTFAVNSEKIDGNSNLLQYVDGVFTKSFSRGDGIQGADNTRHTSKMSNIPRVLPTNFTGEVRGELVISKKNWPIVKELATRRTGKEYKNARNFIAGFLNASDSDTDLCQYMTFVAFEAYGFGGDKSEMFKWLKTSGFTIPVFTENALDMISYNKYQDMVVKIISGSEYDCDGVVIEIDNVNLRDKSIDPDNLNPSHARKIKPPSEAVSTTVTHVEWNVSKDGLLKPIVHFDPVELTGVTISKASGYNAKNIVARGIGVGAVVLITRQGDVIPRVDSVVVSVDAVLPMHAKWDANEVDLISTDAAQDINIAYQVMEYFFSKLEVDFIGGSNAQKLVDAGIYSPVDAILADDARYSSIIGENGRKAVIILRNKLSAVTPAKLFAAMGVFGRGIGERKLKAVFAVIPFLDMIENGVSIERICAIDGFEETTANKIQASLDGASEIYQLIRNHVTFAEEKVAVAVIGKLTGQVFCPTGVRFSPEIAEKITSQGGLITDTFGSTVTTLVAKDPSSNSGKIAKANAKGIKVVSLSQLTSML